MIRFALAAFVFAAPALAQEGAAQVPVLELNRLDAQEGACVMTLVVENPGVARDDLALELVVFDGEARVERLTRLTLGALPQDSTRVRRFTLADLDCADVSRLLINEVDGAETLTLRNKTETEFGQ